MTDRTAVLRHHHEHDDDHGRHRGLRGVLHGLFSPHSHDPADSIDDALESSAAGIRAVKISLVGLGLTALAQLGVVAISGSVALLADTIHNFSDALTALPLWLAFVLGRRAATSRFTYGFGRAEDLAGLFIVVMIALSALFAGIESVRRLVDPVVITNVWWVAAAGLVGFAGNEAVAVYRIRVGRRISSAALVADGVHARTDGLTSLAVLVGALGVAAGFPLADPLVGLLITAMILVMLRSTAREVLGRLMDGVDPALVEQARSALAATPAVLRVDAVRVRWVGHRLHVQARIGVDPACSLAAARLVADGAEQHVRAHTRNVGEVTVDPVPVRA